jgi:DnaJ-class molecular chaperone
MDYYSTLGVDSSADQDTIKRAYKKLAMKHHPDRGGDTNKFQEIQKAYNVLGDDQSRAQYDMEKNGFGGGEFHFTTDNSFDPFSQMFGGRGSPFEQFFRQAGGGRRQQRNRDLNIRCNVTLKQSYTGTELEANYQLPSGKLETVIIKVPAGIQSGQSIRYTGMGDDSVTGIPRGDLMVTVMVEAVEGFDRRGDDLVALVNINPVEAMVGCIKIVTLLDATGVRINLTPGVHHGSEYVTAGRGFKNLHGRIGNLIVRVLIDIPAVVDPAMKEKLEELYAQITNPSESKT